jgi:hypothetical protein
MAVEMARTAFQLRRVTALIGPYGSGKSELAIGLATIAAQQLAAGGAKWSKVALGDIDVLKPYFRSRETGDHLKRKGIELLAPRGALANSDLPILTPELRGNVARSDVQMLLDVGGDPVGARALGSISDVVSEADYDLLLVLNRYRPFMDSLESVLDQAYKIAAATHLKVTGVVSNTNMLEETTVEDVFWGLELAREVARSIGVEVRLLAVSEHLAKDFVERPELPPVVVIRRQMMPQFLGGVVLASGQPPLTRNQGSQS